MLEMEQGMVHYTAQELDDKAVLICVDEEHVFNESAALLQMHPAVREAKHKEIIKKLPENY